MRISESKLLVGAEILNIAAAVVLPEPQTTFQVKWESLELTDLNRLDPYNETHQRRLMISKFSPVRKPACLVTCRVPYMSATVGSVQDDELNPFIDFLPEGDTWWPRGVLAEAEMELCCEVKEDCDSHGHAEEKFPTVLFGPGFEVTRLLYSATAQHIAGMGYEVIVMDHPYETNIVEYPDGTTILGGRVDLNSSESIDFSLNVRAADAAFVLDTLGFTSTDRVIHAGHSFGGAATAVAMATDGRIAGGINLDGTIFGSVLSEGVARPYLLWGSEGHNSSIDPSWGGFIDSMLPRGTWVRELGLKDSLHWSFLDVSIFVELTGLGEKEDLVALDLRLISGSRVMEIVRQYSSDFIQFALGISEEELLKGPSELFGEVDFIL